MVQKKAESIPHLLSTHKVAIEKLRASVQEQLPDLISAETILDDGTRLDNIFYLRYVLSIKNDSSNTESEAHQETVKTIVEHLQWRKKQIANNKQAWCDKNFTNNIQPIEKKLGSKIPMHRTGELKSEMFNGYPVVVLPVNLVDFELLFKQGNNSSATNDLERDVLEFMLTQKEKIYRELDEKSRDSKYNTLVKSVVVYDLNGMSFASIYKLTKFFKLVQKHSKTFKAYFPQSTHSTVILNSPGTWVLKMFSKSKKQRILNVEEFLEMYGAKNAVPSFLNGTAAWPLALKGSDSLELQGEEIESLASSTSIMRTVDEDLRKLDKIELLNQAPGESKVSENQLKIVEKDLHQGILNSKINLTYLEKEMVYMKKNKIFSIDVLEPSQEVNVFFMNKRNKAANILVAVKEQRDNQMFKEDQFNANKMYSVVNSSTVLKQGSNHLKLSMKHPGEILLIYVNRNDSSNSYNSIETAKFSQSKYKRVKEMLKLKKNPYRHAKYDEQKDDKVFFWFEVSDTVQAGEFMGQETVREARVVLRNSVGKRKSCHENLDAKAEPDVKVSKVRRNELGLIDYDEDEAKKLAKKSKTTNDSNLSESFFGFLWS